MTTAKLNNQHDYMSVRASFSKDLKANLTLSRYGMKLSGKGLTVAQMEALLKPFDKMRTLMDKKDPINKYGTYGEMMEAVRVMAENSATPEVLATKLEEACK